MNDDNTADLRLALQQLTAKGLYTEVTLDNGTTIALLGTAHVSQASVRNVEEAILGFAPTVLCIELDAGRLANMEDGENWSKLNLSSVIKQKKTFFLLANLALAGYQRRMAQSQELEAGAEMRRALSLARAQKLEVALCDRDVGVTLKRAWRKSSLWQKSKLLAALLASGSESAESADSSIEELKERDHLNQMMADLATELPKIKEVFIDERDIYLANKIYSAHGKRKLAIVGAGHMKGIIATLERLNHQGHSDSLTDLNAVPKPSVVAKALPFALPLIIVAIFVWGFTKGQASLSGQMGLVWFLANGIPAMIGTLIALGHPLTILVAFLSAPLTSLNPAISVGMVAGLLELLLRKPRVSDFENLYLATTSLKNFYANRVTRILMVVLLSSLGSALGSWFGFFKIFQLVSGS